MGLRSRWRTLVGLAESQEAARSNFSLQLSTLDGVITAANTDFGPGSRVSRDTALSVTSVLRARNLICSIGNLPLVERLPNNTFVQNRWLDQLDPQVSNVVTKSATVEDLLFEGQAWWRVTGTAGSDGYPAAIEHVEVSRVSLRPPPGAVRRLPSGIDPRSVVWIDGEYVDKRYVIRFDSPNPPLLSAARRAIRRAILLSQAVEMYAEGTPPQEFFTPKDNLDVLEKDEVQGFLDEWLDARATRSTAYVPGAFEYNSVTRWTPMEMQLDKSLERVSLELANATGLDPEDFGINTTSRTYQNATDRRKDRINDVLSTYMQAISDRLSMDDVTRPGRKTGWDLRDYLKADPITRADVAKTYFELGAITVDEIREDDSRPPLKTPAPAPVRNQQKGAVVQLPSKATNFSDAGGKQQVHFSSDLTHFAVDTEKRTIRGLAVPYGQAASNGWASYLFLPGSVKWSQVQRVKLLRDHNPSELLGVATELTETKEGLAAAFRIARTSEGDEALSLAEDGILDGLSIGVQFEEDSIKRRKDGTYEVSDANLREVSLTPIPAFDDSRLTSVTAAVDLEESKMPEAKVAEAAQVDPGAEMAESFAAFTKAVEDMPAGIAAGITQAFEATGFSPGGARPVIDPVGTALQVREVHPYRFDGQASEHDLSRDMFSIVRQSGPTGEAHSRAASFVGELFEQFVDKADVNELNPPRERPDMYVDQLDYATPLWDAINKGGIADATPFNFPKFSSSSGLVGDHTEDVEPTPGTFVTTSGTVTPAPVSGKVELTRETIDQGGNPQISTLIRNEFVRSWREALEAKAAALLSGSAPTDIPLTTAAVDEALALELRQAFGALQFIRGGFRMRDLFLNAALHGVIIGAVDTVGRPLFPVLGPQNSDGNVSALYSTINMGGLVGRPAWALPTSASASEQSYLISRMDVHGWASAPIDLRFEYQVKTIEMGVWGYAATAISRLDGVRSLSYDPVA